LIYLCGLHFSTTTLATRACVPLGVFAVLWFIH
jgi:hypothetical protein